MEHISNLAMIPNVSYKDIHTKLSGASSMHPRPTATNIRIFCIHLQNNLTAICSLRSASFGYTDMTKQVDIYELTSKEPWLDFWDPGNIRPPLIDPSMQTNSLMQRQSAQ
eukprot:3522505-Ditylum_brightwellii.AAC.1